MAGEGQVVAQSDKTSKQNCSVSSTFKGTCLKKQVVKN
jgi:hypothetical protein